jgi:hypothetical protein
MGARAIRLTAFDTGRASYDDERARYTEKKESFISN